MVIFGIAVEKGKHISTCWIPLSTYCAPDTIELLFEENDYDMNKTVAQLCTMTGKLCVCSGDQILLVAGIEPFDDFNDQTPKHENK